VPGKIQQDEGETSVKNFWLAAAVIAASGCVSEIDSSSGLGESSETLDTASGIGKPEPPMLGQHWAKDARPNGSGSNPDLLIHSGVIMSSATTVQPIFWGTQWSNSSFTQDKVSGLESFYSAVGGSHYLATNSEYTDLSGATHVSTSVVRANSLFDASASPGHAPKTSAILAEVCKMIANPSPNAYYPVYTDTPRGHAGYCAWHSWGQCNGVNVQFGFFFSLDNDSGCSPADDGSGRSLGLIALANVTGHELSEMLTDPRGNGWTDSSGNENADKCAWVFSQPAQLNGSTWTVQGNWSNQAYDSNTGFANRSGQNGCLYNK
jgi:hypothetical protein